MKLTLLRSTPFLEVNVVMYNNKQNYDHGGGHSRSCSVSEDENGISGTIIKTKEMERKWWSRQLLKGYKKFVLCDMKEH